MAALFLFLEVLLLSDRTAPPTTAEGRELELGALAIDLAERQLRDGSASSQVIVHYLKLMTQRDRIERDILEKQKALVQAKTEALNASRRIESLYTEALDAMRRYSGQDDCDEDL